MAAHLRASDAHQSLQNGSASLPPDCPNCQQQDQVLLPQHDLLPPAMIATYKPGWARGGLAGSLVPEALPASTGILAVRLTAQDSRTEAWF